MKMGDYKALIAYVGVTLVVFLGGLAWAKYRTQIKRTLNLKLYNDLPDHEQDEDHVGRAGAASR
jgi:hypothetical protein